MDIFLEYMVKRKKTVKELLMGVLAVLGAICASLFFTVVITAFIPSFNSFLLLIYVGCGYGAYRIISNMNIEYEYCLTNGELDIDKITARRKRKRIISVNLRHIEICANVYDERFAGEFNRKCDTRIFAASCMDATNIYFLNCTKEAASYKIILEPSEKILEAMRQLNPKAVHIV